MKTVMSVVVVLAIAIGAFGSTADATKGRRPGCLAVRNNSGDDITVYTQGADRDGQWHFKNGTGAVLGDHDGPITVDEETVLWMESDSGITTDHLSLLEDPNTIYSTDTSNALKACRSKPGIWFKLFR